MFVGQSGELGAEAQGNFRQSYGIAPTNDGFNAKLVPVSQDDIGRRAPD
jgi:hypothetical protein